MEWFWHWVDRFQKGAASSALQHFSIIEWIFLCAILWGLIQGGRKGFTDMFGKLLGIFLVSMLTLSFYEAGAANFLSLLPIKIAQPIAFFLLAVFFWVSVSWCINIFGKFFKVEAQGFLKTVGGVIFGVLRMILLLSFLAQFLLLLPIESVQQTFKQGRTFTGYTISRFVPDLHELVVSPFYKPVSRKIAESVKVGG
jgi:uncharacterized membrane protein required for colicin V production